MDHSKNLTESDRYWYDLIQKCRTSGKSDYQWLKENNIKSATFYYHVRQLRKKACELPKAVKRTSASQIQEVVPVFFNEEEAVAPAVLTETAGTEAADTTVAIRLHIHGVCMEISNSATQVIIQNTLSALQNLC